MGDNHRNLKRMLEIYKPNGFDWMNFVVTRRNPFTFHHIVSRSDGGEDTISNGAILTRRAHDLLHILEYVCPEAYADLQDVFMRINESNRPLTNEFFEEINNIMYMIFNKGYYDFRIDIDLSDYCEFFYHPIRKEKTKKLRK